MKCQSILIYPSSTLFCKWRWQCLRAGGGSYRDWKQLRMELINSENVPASKKCKETEFDKHLPYLLENKIPIFYKIFPLNFGESYICVRSYNWVYRSTKIQYEDLSIKQKLVTDFMNSNSNPEWHEQVPVQRLNGPARFHPRAISLFQLSYCLEVEVCLWAGLPLYYFLLT